jgi:hypothetical protein
VFILGFLIQLTYRHIQPVLMGHTDNEADSVLNWNEKCGVNKTLSDLGTALIFNCNMALEAG